MTAARQPHRAVTATAANFAKGSRSSLTRPCRQQRDAGVQFRPALAAQRQLLLGSFQPTYGILSIPLRLNLGVAVFFEFDEAKSRSNKAKHGIDFIEAQALWLDEMLIEIPTRTEDEPRFVVIGVIADKHWSAVITYREDRIRLIAVRRSRDEEVALYEG